MTNKNPFEFNHENKEGPPISLHLQCASLFRPNAKTENLYCITYQYLIESAAVKVSNDGTSDLSLRMHYSRRTGFILVVLI